jgi:hypothetical protein
MRPILMFSLLWLLFGQQVHAAPSLVELAPITAATEHLILIFPGGKVTPEQYRALAATIDARSQGRIAIFAARFSGNLPNPLQTDDRIRATIQLMTAAGLSNPKSRLYLVGHSDGGIMGHAPAAKHRLGGLILLGSYIPHAVIFGGSLAEYPLPTLMMIGDRDGHTGVNFLARELLRLPVSTVAWTKPVLLVNGANHMQMADGSSVAEDLVATTELPAVHLQVARNIIDFIDAQVDAQDGRATSARVRLIERQEVTKVALLPFVETWARHDTLCTENIDNSAESLGGLHPLLFKGQTEFLAFLAAKPELQYANGIGALDTVPTYVEQTPDPFDISLNRYVAPPAIACKYRHSPERTVESGDKGQEDSSCAALNMKAVSEALDSLKTSELGGDYQRLKKEFRNWSWTEVSTDGDTTNQSIGPITLVARETKNLAHWLMSPVKLERIGTKEWRVEVSHWTSSDGVTHCKLIAPLKIVEWATTLLPKEQDLSRRAAATN